MKPSPARRSRCEAFGSRSIEIRAGHAVSPSWRPPPTRAPRRRSRSCRGGSCRVGRSSSRRLRPSRRRRVPVPLPVRLVWLVRLVRRVLGALVPRAFRVRRPRPLARLPVVPRGPAAAGVVLGRRGRRVRPGRGGLRAADSDSPAVPASAAAGVAASIPVLRRGGRHRAARAMLPVASVPKKRSRPVPSPRSASAGTGAGTGKSTRTEATA